MSHTEPNQLAQKLGKILSTENIPNSYYNDESYVACKTSDYDKAYDLVLNTKELSEENLKTSYTMKSLEGGPSADFDLATLLKLVVIGDFGSQYKTTSSLDKNFRVILKIWELSKNGLSKEAHENLWSHKQETPRKTMENLRGRQYQLTYLNAKSLGQVAGNRFDFYSIKRKETLELAHKVSKELMENKDFEEEAVENYESKICENLLSHAESEEERSNISKKIHTLAKNVRNKNYEAVVSTDNYELRKISTKALLFGKCNDKYFNQILNGLQTIEKVISKRGQSLDIDM